MRRSDLRYDFFTAAKLIRVRNRLHILQEQIALRDGASIQRKFADAERGAVDWQRIYDGVDFRMCAVNRAVQVYRAARQVPGHTLAIADHDQIRESKIETVNSRGRNEERVVIHTRGETSPGAGHE